MSFHPHPRRTTAAGALRAAAGLMLVGFASAAMLAGCGASAGDYCEQAAECEGGNEADLAACQARFDGVAEVADLKNCGDEYDLWLECISEKARCNDDRFRVDGDDCENEEDRLQDCAEVSL